MLLPTKALTAHSYTGSHSSCGQASSQTPKDPLPGMAAGCPGPSQWGISPVLFAGRLPQGGGLSPSLYMSLALAGRYLAFLRPAGCSGLCSGCLCPVLSFPGDGAAW